MSSEFLIEKCCLIGHPVAGNPSHYLIEQAIREADSDWRFLTFEVEPDSLGDAMRGLRALQFRGIKVVNPFQTAVLEFVDELSPHAKLAGTANCIRRKGKTLMADNTLGQAVVALAGEMPGRQVELFGAGSAARAVATAIALAGAQQITIINRSPEAAEAIAKIINDETSTSAASAAWPDKQIVVNPETDVLINATRLGSYDHQDLPEVASDSLRKDLTVIDVSYNPPNTPLIQQALEQECPTINGLDIFVEQTALALQSWSGIEADREAMREAGEEFFAI